MKYNHNPVKPPACIIAGGETTVNVKGSGLGGRNQELALLFLSKIPDMENLLFMSCGTDGTDGPTDAAGAYVSEEILRNVEKIKIDPKEYLKDNDSYNVFKKVGGLIKTGPTKTNVMDMQILIVG